MARSTRQSVIDPSGADTAHYEATPPNPDVREPPRSRRAPRRRLGACWRGPTLGFAALIVGCSSGPSDAEMMLGPLDRDSASNADDGPGGPNSTPTAPTTDDAVPDDAVPDDAADDAVPDDGTTTGPAATPPPSTTPPTLGDAVISGLPGVVFVDTTAGTTECLPLCAAGIEAMATNDPRSVDQGISCVVATTAPAATNQACITGADLPTPEPREGVIVVGDSGTRSCVALCTFFSVRDFEPDEDFAFENNAACVLAGSATGFNNSCMTEAALPPSAAGAIVIAPGDLDPTCMPLCVTATVPANEDFLDFGEENAAPCLLDLPEITAGRRSCATGDYPAVFLPPVLRRPKVADGFFTQDGRVFDAYGGEFMMRGISNAHVWYDHSADYLAYEALDNIATYGTNTIRVVWESGNLLSARVLAEVLQRIVELKMVPMVELHDASGLTDSESLQTLADFWTQPDVLEVALEYREYLLINIANEWNGVTNYVSAYTDAINTLRGVGLEHTIVIDGNGWGQIVNSAATRQAQIDTWFSNVNELMQVDDNLIFSVHMYGFYPDEAGVLDVLGRPGVASTIPLIVGEFGFEHSGIDVAFESILQQTRTRGIGWIAWSWHGNSADIIQLDMTDDWEGPLNGWGEDVVNGPNGIVESAVPASIFQ